MRQVQTEELTRLSKELAEATTEKLREAQCKKGEAEDGFHKVTTELHSEKEQKIGVQIAPGDGRTPLG